ncbi:MAG: hypothetical protein Q4F17_10045 [Eubacteriales bacterium]|nr:hypothetical protein [Eubacteriales bacterium]
MGCNGNCGGCTGCGRALELTEPELALLRQLGQIPFLPVERRAGDPTPVYPGAGEQMSLVLQCLEKKGLISLDYDKPLGGFDGYGTCPIRGSLALTQRGQQVLELLEYQGCDGERPSDG